MVGRTLEHYLVEAKLGSGGMGEVYQARDTRLGRTVAIKVLRHEFTSDPERLARFEREARVLASLNHPAIAAIYGFEQAEGVRFLVLEFVPGDILKGPMPLNDALAVARQTAEALEAAHEKGIIHRDLKPANIKITPESKVKVLDFGLAKALAEEPAPGDPSQSPTLSMATRAGVILGTAAYMSPEQARGKPIDQRTDIWAFGCVLYEILAGRRAFQAETLTDTLAAIVSRQPDWQALPEATPSAIRVLLRRCLEKDLNRRLRDVWAARLEIDETLSAGSTSMAVAGPARREGARSRKRAIVFGFVVGLVLGATAAGVALSTFRPAPSAPARARFAITLPPPQALGSSGLGSPALALSPDGTKLVYLSRSGATTQLYSRRMDQLEARPIPGTEDADGPIFSPDGEWLAFFAEGKLKKVAVAGGPAVALSESQIEGGADWGPDDSILFSSSSWVGGLWRMPAAGGKAEPVTRPDTKKGESTHRWPQHLPGGNAILFANWKGPSPDNATVEALILKTGERRVLVPGAGFARYVPTGHLVYARGGALVAAPFDLARLAVTGPSVPVLDGVWMGSGTGAAHFSVATDGSLVYVPARSLYGERTLVSVDRAGVARPLTESRRPYEDLWLSPDGTRLALTIEGPAWNVWVLELARGTLSRFTLEHDNRDPFWTPDSKRIVYSSFRAGRYGMYWKPADGSGPEEQLTSSENPQLGGSWSPDSRVLVFNEVFPNTGFDVFVLSGMAGAPGERKPRLLLQTKFAELFVTFSPDGRWLVYASNESGRDEVYVQPYPGPGARVQISTAGGSKPVWGAGGRDLYYRNGDKMLVVPIETKPVFKAGSARVLFEGRYWVAGHDYDVSPAGDRFYMIQEGPAPTQITVVQDWFDELKRRVPRGRK